MNRTKRQEPIPMAGLEITFAILQGSAIAFVLLLIFLFCSALSIHHGHFTQEHMSGMVLVSTLLASLLGGLFTLSIVKKNKLLVGLAVGFLLFSLLLTIGRIFYPSFQFGNAGPEILFASLVGGGMGKIFSVKKKKSH